MIKDESKSTQKANLLKGDIVDGIPEGKSASQHLEGKHPHAPLVAFLVVLMQYDFRSHVDCAKTKSMKILSQTSLNTSAATKSLSLFT